MPINPFRYVALCRLDLLGGCIAVFEIDTRYDSDLSIAEIPHLFTENLKLTLGAFVFVSAAELNLLFEQGLRCESDRTVPTGKDLERPLSVATATFLG